VEPHLVHVPSELINAFDQKWGASLLGDKAHSMVFDNTKIKRVVPGYRAEYPFSRGVEEILAWHSAHPENQKVDAELDALIDRILIAYRSAWPKG
jgi:nucleoside-diphosphate-sugar epimerase